MTEGRSLRSTIKAVPVLGPSLRLANRSRLFLRDKLYTDWRTEAMVRMKHRVSWYISSNPRSQRRFVRGGVILTAEQRKLVESLSSDGVAATGVDRVGVPPSDWSALREVVGEFARYSTERIATATHSYSDEMTLDSLEHNRERFRRFFRDKNEAKLDDYILKMNPENSVLAPNHPLLAIGLSAPVLSVVSGYMNLWPKLIYADAWYSIPMDPGRRIGSQQWHRDPEDKKMVKVYLYFSEVDESAGAMEYILGSSNAVGGEGLKVGEWKAAGANLYPPAEEVEQKFSAARHFYCSGPVGTLLFCDTTGIHRGGISRSRARVVATWTFVTPASRHKRRFTVGPTNSTLLSKEARFALDIHDLGR